MMQTRRGVLQLCGGSIATVTTAGLAGCSGPLDGGSSGGDGGLSMVPSDAAVVARGDVTRTLQDSAVDRFVDAALEPLADAETYDGPTTKGEALDVFTEETGLNLDQAELAVGFGKYESADTGGYSGLWFRADWSSEAVVEALTTEYRNYTEGDYNGSTVYEPDHDYGGSWLGIPASNAYVLGTETAVKETIDVADGEMDSVGGTLVDAYSSVRDAPFKFVSTVPSDSLPQRPFQIGDSSVDPQRFADVEHVAGATYHEDDVVGITLTLFAGDGDDAATIRDALEGAIAGAKGSVADETINDALEEITVERDGTKVTADVSGSVDRAVTLIETLANLLLGG